MGLGAWPWHPCARHREDIIGTLAISYREPREIPQATMDLLQGMADQAAIALSNSRLYEALQRLRAPLPLPAHERPGHRVLDRPGRPLHVPVRRRRARSRAGRADELLGRKWREVVDLEASPGLREAFEAMRQPPFPSASQRFFLRASRRVARCPADMRGVAIVSDGRVRGAHGIVRDLREQVRLEDDLRRQATELATAGERARLAQELHDSVTQALFRMTLTTRTVELLVDRDPEGAKRMLGELRALEREALAEMRALIFELRPGHLRSRRPGAGAADARRGASRAGWGCPSRVDCAPVRSRAAGRRGRPLPDRPGGAPQRRQARGRDGRCRSAWTRPRRRAAPARRATTARASTRPRSPRATWG